MDVFRAYDIRGIYGQDLDEAFAGRLGQAVAAYLAAGPMVVGRDMRPHSAPLSDALIDGLLRGGAKVIDLGEVSTPMCYFANGHLHAAGSVMVTASHNPPAWNGFKICREAAIPLRGPLGPDDRDAELTALARLVAAPGSPVLPLRTGSCRQHDIGPAYAAMVRRHCRFQGRPRIVADCANGMGMAEIAGLRSVMDVIPLFPEPDGRFPNHPANPLPAENLAALCRAVPACGAVFGVAFDGDADRCGFVDEQGTIVSMDLVTALFAGEALEAGPAPILHDVRSSRAVREYIAECGGSPVPTRVGHAFAKLEMRRLGAAFGGELAGHYYFREEIIAESAARAVVTMANLLAEAGRPLSAVVAPLKRYANSGEINLPLPDAATVRRTLAAVRERFAEGRQSQLDGLTTEFPDWWFNLRPSNTEPKLRLIVEADDQATLDARRRQLLTLIGETAGVAPD
jgi:phosphomannomutase